MTDTNKQPSWEKKEEKAFEEYQVSSMIAEGGIAYHTFDSGDDIKQELIQKVRISENRYWLRKIKRAEKERPYQKKITDKDFTLRIKELKDGKVDSRTI